MLFSFVATHSKANNPHMHTSYSSLKLIWKIFFAHGSCKAEPSNLFVNQLGTVLTGCITVLYVCDGFFSAKNPPEFLVLAERCEAHRVDEKMTIVCASATQSVSSSPLELRPFRCVFLLTVSSSFTLLRGLNQMIVDVLWFISNADIPFPYFSLSKTVFQTFLCEIYIKKYKVSAEFLCEFL
jgi:hypothetical protein